MERGFLMTDELDITGLESPIKKEQPVQEDDGLDVSGLASPVKIREVAKEIHKQNPEISTLGEIEGFLTLGSSMVATPVAGLAGLVHQTLNAMGVTSGDTEDATETISDVAQALTYSPRTESGEIFAERLAYPFELLDKAGQWVGDAVFDVTESPTAGATAKTGTMFLIPAALRKTVQTTGKLGKKGVMATKALIEPFKMVREQQRTAYSKEAVGRSLRQNIGDSAEVTANIAEAAKIEAKVPALEFTLAERTGKPSVQARERALAEKDQPTFDIAKGRREANVRALEDFRMQNFGDSAPEIASILRNSKGNISKATRALEERMVELQADRAAVAKKAPFMELEGVGKKLRALEEAEYKAAKATGELLYNKIGNVKVNPEGILAEVNSIFKNELLDFTPEQIPSSFNRVVRELSPKRQQELPTAKTIQEFMAREEQARSVPEMSFDQLRSLEKSLKNDLAAERGKLSGRNRTTEHLINRVVERVEAIKEGLRNSPDKSIVKAYDEATTFWREGVVNRFYKGAGRDIDAKTAMNEYRIVDEKVIDSFFSQAKTGKGGVKGIDDFINTFGMNPEAWAQLRLGIFSKFREATGVNNTGVIDPTKATVFLNKHKAVLDRVPRIRDEIANIHDANLSLADAAKLIKQRQVNVEHSTLSKLLKSSTPDTVVKSAISPNANKMSMLHSMAKKVKGGTDALSKETGRQVLKLAERNDGSINSQVLVQVLRNNEKSLRKGMGDKHFEMLDTIHKAYNRIDANILPKGVKEPKVGLEAVGEKLGTTPAQAISAWRAQSRGLVGAPHLLAQIGTSFITRINKRQIDAIERIAHYDKEVAKTLTMMIKSDKLAPVVEKRMSKHLVDYGLLSLAVEEVENDR